MAHAPTTIRILGPVEVEVQGTAQAVPGRNTRAVLSALTVSVGHSVDADVLLDMIWGDETPRAGHAALHPLISRLRHLVGPEAIVTSPAGYMLAVDPGRIDAVCFERLVVSAGDTLAADPGTSRIRCRRALDLWRGNPFGDVADLDFARLEALRLDELRIAAMEVGWEADLALGRARWIVAALEAEVQEQPYRETAWALLIRALAEVGRRREAVTACARVRRLLAEVGLEPGAAILHLEHELFEAPAGPVSDP